MAVKIGINGFGRIGRCVLRTLVEQKVEGVEVVGINDLTSVETLAHLLKYDSVHRSFDAAPVGTTDKGLTVGGKDIQVSAIKDPKELPWKDLGVDIVLECTGIFTKREAAAGHLDAGAKKVIISAPAKGDDLTIVCGVNDSQYDSAKHHVISCASCTTNCMAPVAKVMLDNFGIEYGLMTTIHSYTNDQNLLDLPHKKDLRRARAAAMSMIPTSTGAAKAVSLVIPELEGKFDGLAIRVPTPDVSLVDLVVSTTKPVTVDAINAAMKAAAEGPLKGVLQYCEEPLVSSDFIGNPHSSIFDATVTKIQGEKMAKIFSWYDNEWGFACRMVDLATMMAGKL